LSKQHQQQTYLDGIKMTDFPKRANDVADKILANTSAIEREKLAHFSIDDLVSELARDAMIGTYEKLPNLVGEAFTYLDDCDKDGRLAGIFARLLTLGTITRWYTDDHDEQKSIRLDAVRDKESNRILETAEKDVEGNYIWHPSSEVYVKDLQCYTGRIVPCGAQLADLRSGFGRRLLVAGGLARIPGNAKFLLAAGLSGSYIQIHTHTPTLSEFNEPGWEACYLCIADLCRNIPTLSGFTGGSWFYDPALETVSPRLSYLRHTPLAGGANAICAYLASSSIITLG